MKIEVFGCTEESGLVKARAKVVWEDNDRPSQEVFFGVPEEYAEYLCCNSDAFLVAGLLPAVNAGERRISISEDVCSKLQEDLPVVVDYFGKWYGGDLRMPQIQTNGKPKWMPNSRPREAGSFLSGGIDSLALLRRNRLRYPTTHSRSIKHCFLVYGFDMGAEDSHSEAFERALKSLSEVAKDANVKLIPVYTNIKSLNYDFVFWLKQFHGACLAAVGHAVATKVRSISIAASDCVEDLEPRGSHPLIDPNYSSAEMLAEYAGLRYSRIQKIRLVADWESGLQNVRVCTQINSVLRSPSKGLNCGKCEKCIRTMTALLAIGVLHKTRAFAENDVSREMLRSVPVTGHFPWLQYRELIEPLKSKGRNDLARVIERMLLTYRVKEGIRSIDNRLFGGRLLRTARRTARET